MDIYSHGFSVGYQNIHGLHTTEQDAKASKLENELKNDIEIWSEIWGCECELKLIIISMVLLIHKNMLGSQRGENREDLLF